MVEMYWIVSIDPYGWMDGWMRHDMFVTLKNVRRGGLIYEASALTLWLRPIKCINSLDNR